MTLQIRDARARALAQELAEKRKVTLTTAVIQALEGELKREGGKVSLAKRVAQLAGELKDQAGPGGRTPSKDEIDDMWGQP
ncbi:type II toxin-antitoxin system VapB family antitoxin [Rhizobium sp. S-51]|uniref:Type II toxin-antitoxin system VapB family antitoxin n=1 Tax=Rhizobium terricola TaxID=2728849 RepID=A0A7Y0AYQ6_9HYPH|nr:type II toxin-antitoxin system VapB family antitoxin [Rhizobium terricola]NML75906.1 type II toxin-antitoxin system VapB family antitoxin [Rhizobium terricola]